MALLAALPFVVVAAPEGQPAGQPVVEAPRQVTGNTNPVRLFDIPALAVDPGDPSTVVMAVGDARNGGCGLRVSRDGGRSWAATAPSLMPPDLPFCYQRPLFPVMDPLFSPDGTLHVAMPASTPETGHPNGPIGMLVANTDDLGITSSLATVAEGARITADPREYGHEGQPQEAFTWYKSPSLVADPTNPDRLYLGMRWNVWGTDLQSFDGEMPFRPYLSISDDGGATWSEPTDMVEGAEGLDVYGSLNIEMAVAPDGTVYGVTREWLDPAAEGDPQRRLLLFTSTDGGSSWTVSSFLDEVENFDVPYPVIDPTNGNLYVVYAGADPEATAEDADVPPPNEIFFTASEDGGETFSDPVRITDNPAEQTADSFTPGISIAPDGRIDVAWYDFRNDPFGPGQIEGSGRGERYWDVYHTSSSDGGRTWARNTRVTPTSIDGAEGATFNNMEVRGPIGLASTDDSAYVAWADARATGQGAGSAEDAYFTRLRFGAAPQSAPAGDTGGGRLLWLALGAGGALALAGLFLVGVVRRRRARAGQTTHAET